MPRSKRPWKKRLKSSVSVRLASWKVATGPSAKKTVIMEPTRFTVWGRPFSWRTSSRPASSLAPRSSR